MVEEVRCAYAALQYFQFDRSLIDIGTELGVSRFMVGRMVKRARDEGLISITSHLPDPVDVQLSKAFATHFGIESALLVITPSEDALANRRMIAAIAARNLRDTVVEDDIIGLTVGRTIVEMSKLLTALPSCDVIQLTGVADAHPERSVEAITSISRLAGGRMFPLHAPFVTTDEAAAVAIRSQPGISKTLKRLERVSKAVVTIGAWPKASLLYESLDGMGEATRLVNAGVVAEIGTTLLDIKGHEVQGLRNRLIGISTTQLSAIKEVTAIGGAPGRAQAVLATLRSGLVTGLITDVHTAREVLSLDAS